MFGHESVFLADRQPILEATRVPQGNNSFRFLMCPKHSEDVDTIKDQ